jgi:hypothetical protein
MNSCSKESTIVPQLLYLPGVHFNQADGAGDGRSLAGYGDCAERSAEGNRFILAFSNTV